MFSFSTCILRSVNNNLCKEFRINDQLNMVFTLSKGSVK